MLEDIVVERNKIEQAHREWLTALDAVNNPMFLHDQQFRILRCNKAYQQCAGMPFQEIIGQPYYAVFPKSGAPFPYCLGSMEKAEKTEVTVGNAIYHSSAFAIHDEEGIYLYSVHLLEDITERSRAKTSLEHANRALSTLTAVNSNLVHASNEGELLQAICDAIVQQHGYRMAWVGYIQHDDAKSIKVMARAGHDDGYLDAAQISWAENERGMSPSGRAVRCGITQLCQDIANDPLFQPWREAAIKRGYAGNISLALKNENGEVFGILTMYAEEAQAFTADEISLLEEMADNLAFGVHTIHIRHERDLALVKIQEQLVQLQDSLKDTMQAIARIVEMRDPYTAGHQVRVAELAGAIATQMGLPDEQVHAIQLTGTVHDLGKIQIPAEILSKPGKITDLEYGLIKIHAQAGYDILKDIHFPWPIAQMVLQHHERMDGSGYPQGLKGNQIILGARILSVADVVEAMSSHRPYRVGLGVGTALAEISAQRGSHFDPRVVDACLALFREQHYSIKS
jgi:HD-GYP domain-containing protein (c-di-GMP phosphodiesterase class II)